MKKKLTINKIIFDIDSYFKIIFLKCTYLIFNI